MTFTFVDIILILILVVLCGAILGIKLAKRFNTQDDHQLYNDVVEYKQRRDGM